MWEYNGSIFEEEMIGNHIGFVYLIVEKDTNKKYVGQKIFFNKVAKKPLKGKKNRRISKKPSDWMDYYGSNEELKLRVEEQGSENYHREIIRLCKSKAEMNYHELHEIIVRGALLTDDYYNAWVSCRINKNQLKSISK